jgi:4-amino-4-deoxy-L-arabinose transferase-like glycosyltransferase
MGGCMPRGLLLLVVFVAASAFLTPFQRELYVGDETKYAQVVREVRDGAFFLPTLHGQPFTHKPPLHFWIIDLLTFPLGLQSLWAFVLPSLAAFVALLWMMNRIGSPLAAFVCGTSLMVWGSAQTARMDVSFTALLTLAAWQLRKFLDEGNRHALVWSGVATGVATLVKGPMAPVIILSLLLIEKIRRKRLPRGNYALFAVTMSVIPLLWFVPAMMLGGGSYTQEVLIKQTAGRAVGAWVHKAAPWYYLTHAPGDLFPWFFLLLVAIVAVYRRKIEAAKFEVSWILAVLIPYSLLSSKLDIYMITMIPAVSLVIARFVSDETGDRLSRWGWRANVFVLGLLLGVGIAGLTIVPRNLKPADRPLAELPAVRGLFIVFIVTASAGLLAVMVRRQLRLSTIAVGLVPIVAFSYAAIALVPIANEHASTRPLVRAILAQNVPPERVVLFTSPHLWTRDMPPSLARVNYADAERVLSHRPEVIVTSRRYSKDIAGALSGYRKVGEFRMIGKPFDVYRR